MNTDSNSQLESKKLQQELRYSTVKLYLSILGSVVVLLGLYFDRVQTRELRKKELAAALFKQRSDSYLALMDSASSIAGCHTFEEVKKASSEFIRIYCGRAHVVAESDPEIFDAKVAFYEQLTAYLDSGSKDAKPPLQVFLKPALAITTACKKNVDPRNME